MKKDVQWVSPMDSVQTAAQKMRDSNVGFLPVCETDQRVVGTLTDRDIAVRLVAENLSGALTVQDVMSRDLVLCRPSDPIDTAMVLMGNHQKARLLCVEDGDQLVGVISLSDLSDRVDLQEAGMTLRHVSSRERHS